MADSQDKAHILIIEDEPGLRAEIVAELVAIGYEATAAENGRVAFGLLKTLLPDIIICDITLPHMTGYEILSEIRAKMPELDRVPFIFLTAHDSREHRLKGFRTGADDFLTKPVDFDILDATIKARISSARRILNSEKTFPPPPSTAHLSKRETEVLRLLAEGNRVATIADTLSISYHTARQYKKTLYTKLRINNRSGATLEAIKRKLISLT